jgi:hypothetical protein
MRANLAGNLNCGSAGAGSEIGAGVGGVAHVIGATKQ